MPTTYHMVHYRRFDAGGADLKGATLEQLCRTALDVADASKTTLWQRIGDRLYDLADTEGRQIFLNKVADLSSAIFGEMCLVQRRGPVKGHPDTCSIWRTNMSKRRGCSINRWPVTSRSCPRLPHGIAVARADNHESLTRVGGRSHPHGTSIHSSGSTTTISPS